MAKKLTSIRMCEIVTNLEKDSTKLIDLDTLENLLKSKKALRTMLISSTTKMCIPKKKNNKIQTIRQIL